MCLQKGCKISRSYSLAKEKEIDESKQTDKELCNLSLKTLSSFLSNDSKVKIREKWGPFSFNSEIIKETESNELGAWLLEFNTNVLTENAFHFSKALFKIEIEGTLIKQSGIEIDVETEECLNYFKEIVNGYNKTGKD